MIQQIHFHYLSLDGVGCQQRQGGQSCRADGESFAGGRRGVTQGVQGVGALPYFGIKLGLLGDTASVVSHRTVGVRCKSDTQGGK